jgi:hypothetical protein
MPPAKRQRAGSPCQRSISASHVPLSGRSSGERWRHWPRQDVAAESAFWTARGNAISAASPGGRRDPGGDVQIASRAAT